MFFQNIIKGALSLMTGVLFLIIINGCTSAEIVVRTEPGYEDSIQDVPSDKKGGPPPWAPAHGYRAKHRYRYYPVAQVYYNVNRGSYIYYRNGRWEVSVSLPERIKINLNEYVTLEMDTDRPYTYHTDVIKKYPPGQLKKRKRKKQWNK